MQQQDTHPGETTQKAQENKPIEYKVWQSHKKVMAFKITDIDPVVDARYQLHGADGECMSVDKDYMDKHQPEVGGYFVQYVDNEDKYCSWSPAAAFEEGYVHIGVATSNELSQHPFQLPTLMGSPAAL